MPRSLRIEAFKELNNYATVLIVEPFWWYQAQLKERYEFAEVEEIHGYLDYTLPLTKELLEKINSEEIINLKSSFYQNSGGRKELQAEADDKLKILNENFESYKLVRINIYEYDSFD